MSRALLLSALAAMPFAHLINKRLHEPLSEVEYLDVPDPLLGSAYWAPEDNRHDVARSLASDWHRRMAAEDWEHVPEESKPGLLTFRRGGETRFDRLCELLPAFLEGFGLTPRPNFVAAPPHPCGCKQGEAAPPVEPTRPPVDAFALAILEGDATRLRQAGYGDAAATVERAVRRLRRLQAEGAAPSAAPTTDTSPPA